jgi:alpha-soluble NSF attachment protein
LLLALVEAVKVLKQAVEMLKERGRFHPAAGYQKQIAEIYETDIVDTQQAMTHYEEAAELYAGEEAGGCVHGFESSDVMIPFLQF